MSSEIKSASPLCIFLVVAAFAFATQQAMSQPSVVKMVSTGERTWELLRNGEPMFVKGFGGSVHLDKAASLGANSIRTWGIDENTSELLDRAHRNNLTVTLGFWMGHKRHHFNYDDPAAVELQKRELLAAVRKYKDHPALLCWGVGNEVELQHTRDPKIWQAINAAAKAIKELDPNHPTISVIAELGGENSKLKSLQRYCPDIDIVGINSYDGAVSAVRRYAEFGLDKPCLLTEYGPALRRRNRFGQHAEPSSTEKAKIYKDIYQNGILAHPGFCLGGYSFIWGAKIEKTDTFFGQLLAGGERLAQAEVYSELFGAKRPTNLCPEVQPIATDSATRVSFDGEPIAATFSASDPDGDSLTYRWELKTELPRTVGGDRIETHRNLKEYLKHTGPESSEVTVVGAPPGKYRLYAYVYDGKGNAATDSISVMEKKRVPIRPAPPIPLPLTLYSENNPESPYSPSGIMGDRNEAVKMTFDFTDNPQSGETCLRVVAPHDVWSGVNWQHPPNDWGESEGGFDVTGATQLSFWARGAKGGEKVTFAIGGIGIEATYYDTVYAKLEVELTKEWKQYSIDLSGRDLSRIKTPFHWSVYDEEETRFFLDEIRIN